MSKVDLTKLHLQIHPDPHTYLCRFALAYTILILLGNCNYNYINCSICNLNYQLIHSARKYMRLS